MTELKDKGIVRHEYYTVSLKDCKESIEAVEFVKSKREIGEDTVYNGEYGGSPFEIRVTPTRAIFFGVNRFALFAIAHLANYEFWEYSGDSRTDYFYDKGRS